MLDNAASMLLNALDAPGLAGGQQMAERLENN